MISVLIAPNVEIYLNSILSINPFSIALPLSIVWAGIFLFLALVGFFRSTFEKVRPNFILDQKKVQDEWLSRSPFTAILLPIMALAIFVFNAIAWAVYGLISIAEFMAFILKALWWLILWIWNEVIHPVVFLVVKLVWHYLVIWSWRFFKISFTRIPESYTKETYKNGFISAFILSFIFFSFFYLTILLEQNWIMGIMIVAMLFAALYFSGFTLFDDKQRLFKEYYSGTMIFHLGIMILILISCFSSIVILSLFNNTAIQLPILGISFPIIQILIIIFTVAFIASLFSISIFPAYMVSNDGIFETKDFLLNLVKRLPRIIGAAPFMVLGGIVASIATILLGAFLWWSTHTIKTFFCERSLENMKVELQDENEAFYAFYDTVNVVRQAKEYPDKDIKRIAKLESRIFSLHLGAQSWYQILLNLPEGVRSLDSKKEVLDNLQLNYIEQNNQYKNAIAEQEKMLAQLNAEFSKSPENPILMQQLERQREYVKGLKLNHQKIRSQYVLDTRLNQTRMRSINGTNVMWIIGTFLAMLGFALLAAIVLTPYWILRTKVYFDLYDYYHQGKSYFTEQVEFYKQRNINQPLLGLFVFIVIGLLYLIF